MKICNNCKHCDKPFPHSEYAHEYGCKKHYSVDKITGDIYYENCSDKNKDGNCEEYEDNWIVKLKSFFGL